MSEMILPPRIIDVEGTEPGVIAVDVSIDDYMEHYAAYFCEYVEGVVIKMLPHSIPHDQLMYFLRLLITAYFELRPIGRIIGQPFVMRLPAFPNRRREPDLFVVLNSNPYKLHDTYMDGPADLCIEVVSLESVGRDHGEKFAEYEKGGVPEYWIVDRRHKECRFYRLNEQAIYIRQQEDAEGYYRTPALPGLTLHVPTLWLDALPGPAATVDFVRRMLEIG
jgi:Uma2 family endonuclease